MRPIGQYDTAIRHTAIRHSEDPRYAGGQTLVCKPASPVEDVLNRLEASINATASDFGSLAAGLAPALRPDTPPDTPPETSNPSPASGIELVDRLHVLSLKVEALQWHVVNVNSRLAL